MVMFRVDFGGDIGLGHLKRSLVYAKNYDKVTYVSKNDMKEFIPYPLYSIKDESEFFALVEKLQPCEVIIDNYNFTLEHEKTFKKSFPDIKLSVFDDDYREHFCDEIINHNIYAKKSRYKNPDIAKIIPPLIRKEFKLEQKRKYKKEGILLSLGGSDALGLTIKILKILGKKKINLYITSATKNLTKIKRYCYKHKNISLHLDEDLAKGMAKSKFAIISVSTLVYEALFMKLPFIAIKVAPNQLPLFKYLKKNRYSVIETRKIKDLDKQNVKYYKNKKFYIQKLHHIK